MPPKELPREGGTFVSTKGPSAGDLGADLAALRQDVAKLAETMSQLVQHQT